MQCQQFPLVDSVFLCQDQGSGTFCALRHNEIPFYYCSWRREEENGQTLLKLNKLCTKCNRNT